MFSLKGLFARKGAKDPAPPQQSGADIGAEWLRDLELRSGDAERPSQVPAWAMILRSPYLSWHGAKSWLGGVPHAPEGFDWPRSAEGKPLHFLAQIDPADVPPDPLTGARPKGLPPTGALLVFADYFD